MACSVWKVRRTPHRARRKCVSFSRSSPNARTVPEAGRTNPDKTLKNVVLPAPLGPMSPQVPLSKVRLMPSSDVTPPYLTVRFWTSITPDRLRRHAGRLAGGAGGRRRRGRRRGRTPREPPDHPAHPLHVLS